MPAFTDFRYILHENGETRNAMWRKRGKDSLPILPFLPCLLSKNSHFCATASQNGGVNRNRQIGQNCAINCGIRGIYSNKNLIQSKNLFAVKSILNLVQRLARYRSGALISKGRLCTILFYRSHVHLERCDYYICEKYTNLNLAYILGINKIAWVAIKQ